MAYWKAENALNITTLRKPAPSLQQWNELIKPEPGQGDAVVLGRRADEPLPASIDAFRQQVAGLDFHALDPYVASVGGSISAGQVELPKGEQELALKVPEFYAEDVEVKLGAFNGPGAPMLLILPGIHGEGDGSHANLLKKLALERGMNYVVFPNSLSKAMLEDKPFHHPGNPRLDAQSSHVLLKTLKQQMPEYFGTISVAGYSYGGLHGANLVRYDEELGENLVNGSLVALSPPENLDHSMRELDGLRLIYEEGDGEMVEKVGLQYKHDVKKYGYERFFESGLSQHGPGSNITEIEICDKYGSRDSLKELVEILDTQFGHNRLPMNTPEYDKANLLEKWRLRQEHKQIVANMTYDQLCNDWISKDAWLQQQGMTPSQMAERYSLTRAIEAIEETPVLILSAADDYILAAQDIPQLEKLAREQGPQEVMRVFPVGGHVGLDWNPRVAETMIDFAVGGHRG